MDDRLNLYLRLALVFILITYKAVGTLDINTYIPVILHICLRIAYLLTNVLALPFRWQGTLDIALLLTVTPAKKS